MPGFRLPRWPNGRNQGAASPAEENHRWTQMNTDSEGRTPVSLRLALGHCPVTGFSPRKSEVLSSSYLCLSVSICGCTKFLRLGLHFGQAPFFGQLIQQHGDHAPQVPLLTAEEPDKQRQRQQQ